MALDRRSFIAGAAGLVAAQAVSADESARPVLHRGINLWPWFSLTREFPAPRTDYAWPPFQLDRPVPVPRDLALLRRIGFDFARIPLDPGPFLAALPPQREQLIAQVMDAVRLTLEHDLAVVVNVQANAATHHWTPQRMFASVDAPAFPAYRDLVAELAMRLGDIGSRRVVLEPVNEPFQVCGATEWTRVQAELLGAARRAAPGLTLVATGSCGSMIDGLEKLSARALAAFGPLLFTFHFYEPYLFTHQGAPWMTGEPIYRALNAVPWPAQRGSLDATLAAVRARMAVLGQPADGSGRAVYAETERVLKVYFDAQPDRPFIDSYLRRVRDWGAREGVAPGRILLGEFGALRSDARYVASGAADRARYIRDVRQSAEAFGFPWAYWNLFDGFSLFESDVTRQPDPAIVSALGLVMP